jgi:hypothetical protein
MTFEAERTGICPHCKDSNRFEYVTSSPHNYIVPDYLLTTGKDSEKTKILRMCRCTSCGDIIVLLDGQVVYPLGSTHLPCPEEVPEEIATDYKEACLVESYSKKAAAALIRRCLQSVFHNQGIIKSNLNEEIDEAITKLPSYLSRDIDAIRQVGNFAAHPVKYTNTGEIVEVEENEADWLLDVIEQLFDFYYVAPNKSSENRMNLNNKLQAAGKPLLKT